MTRSEMEKLVKEMKERCEKATPGEWVVKYESNVFMAGTSRGIAACGGYQSNIEDTYTQNINNADFIAHARQDVPALITALEEAWAEKDRYKEAAKIYKEASFQSHSGHWDSTMQHGAGCPECIRSRELRDKADTILAALKEKP